MERLAAVLYVFFFLLPAPPSPIWPLQGFLSILEVNILIQLFVSIAIHGYNNIITLTIKAEGDARNIFSIKVNPKRKQMLVKYLLVNYFFKAGTISNKNVAIKIF